VFVNDIGDYEQLFSDIDKMIKRDNIKLFILDNIADLCNNFQRQDSTIDYFERAQFLTKHAQTLKTMGSSHRIQTIVFNNVVTDSNVGAEPNIPGAKSFYNKQMGFGNKSKETAAMGMLWAS
jgi:hypothetical protein